MSKNHKLVQRYVKAFAASVEDKNFYEVSDELGNLVSSLDDSVNSFLKSAIIKETDKEEYINIICDKLNLRAEIKRLLVVLAQRQRLELLGEIYSQFVFYMNRKFNKAFVVVESKYKLEKDMVEEISKLLHSKFNQDIIIEQKINEDIIGGITIKKDDLLIDMTLNTRLKKMQEKLHDIIM